MKPDIVYEVVDLRNLEIRDKLNSVALLQSSPGGLLALQGRKADFLPLPEDDSLEIEGERLTVYTEDGMIVFDPVKPGSDILEFLGLDLELLWLGLLA